MYKVQIDLPNVADAVFPTLSMAVAKTAAEGATRWKNAVMKAKLWSAEKDQYINSITWKMTGAASAEISASFPMAGEIETGRPRKDLKAMLETSVKTRAVKGGENKGRKYLIIPLRHRISSMPTHVLQKAQALEKSFVAPPGSINPPTRVSATGHTVKRHSYLWGGRLESGLTHKLPQHKTDIFAGMVRFDTSAGKANSSAYMTFRVMGEWQDGWIVGPKPGLYLAKGVTESLRGLLRQSVADAMKNDLTRSSVVTGQ